MEGRLDQRTGGQALTMVTGEYENGYWISLSPEKYSNPTRAFLVGGKDAGHYLKFGKGLFSELEENFRPSGGRAT